MTWLPWRTTPDDPDWTDVESVAQWIEHVRWSAFFGGARGDEISHAEAAALVKVLAGIETGTAETVKQGSVPKG